MAIITIIPTITSTTDCMEIGEPGGRREPLASARWSESREWREWRETHYAWHTGCKTLTGP